MTGKKAVFVMEFIFLKMNGPLILVYIGNLN